MSAQNDLGGWNSVSGAETFEFDSVTGPKDSNDYVEIRMSTFINIKSCKEMFDLKIYLYMMHIVIIDEGKRL